jgi:glutamine synthetase
MYLKTPSELAEMGIRMLPATLAEAVDEFEADPFTQTVFGPVMYKAWIEYKREEWRQYINYVSDWEKQRYLKFF